MGKTKMNFGDKLKELRTAKGMTQKNLADAVGVAQSAIARWEIGQQIPSFDVVQAICLSLGVSCNVFDGCRHEKTDSPRGRGRPSKEDK